MSKSRIKFHKLTTDRASLDAESFCTTWMMSDNLEEVYQKIEEAWKEAHPDKSKSFYKSRESGYKQLRGRATKYRKRDVPLKRLIDEQQSKTTAAKVDYGYLKRLCQSLSSNT